MTNATLTDTKPSLLHTLRAKIHMARWNLLLWATFAVLIAISCWRLFPGALFWVDGGLRGIMLVCSVDFVLGPLLFILVANPSKSPLARRVDVITLTAVQLLAMAWGGWQIYTQRPVAISYMREGFALPVIMKPFTEQGVTPESLPSSRIGTLPPAFFVNLPTGKGAAKAYYQATRHPQPLTAQAGLLVPLFQHDQLYANAGRFQAYWAREGAGDWQRWSTAHGNQPAADYRFILLGGRYGNAALVLDQHNELLGHVRLPDGDPSMILPAK